MQSAIASPSVVYRTQDWSTRDRMQPWPESTMGWIERTEQALGENALKELFEIKPFEDRGPAVAIHPDRCVAARGAEGCLKCVAACTAGCISERDRGLAFNPEKCVGCGACATACPTCAIEAVGPTDDELKQRLAHACRNTQLTIMCTPRVNQIRTEIDNESIAEVTCLGRIEESILIEAVSKGIQKITLVHANCDRCNQNGGSRCAITAVRNANNLLRLWQRPSAIQMTRQAPSYTLLATTQLTCTHAPEPGPSMDSIGNEAFRGYGPVLSPEFEVEELEREGNLPKTITKRRASLLESLSSLGPTAYTSAVSHLWASIEIDAHRCDGCRKCLAICPTGALSCSEKENGFFGVVHRVSLCVNCRACSGACPNEAITANSKVRIADLLHGVARPYEMKRTALTWYA